MLTPKTTTNALGIIFPNTYDALVPELSNVRLMASIPFASRYRLIDFILSNMVNNDVTNISIIVRNNYFSLMDHLGSGREWDLTRKNGGLHIFPPYASKDDTVYNGRVDALAHILDFLRGQKEKYVMMADCNIAVNFDFKDMLEKHIESGADVTAAYIAEPLPDSAIRHTANDRGLYYTFTIDEGRVSKIYINSKETGVQNFGMNIYCIERELLIDLINTAFVRGYTYFERDVLAPQLDTLKVMAYEYKGYAARITDMKNYFDENMKLLDDINLNSLFSGNQIYTKIRDDNPTRYIAGAKVKNTMAADGCVIEGEVENSILFRGVKVGKGTRIKNCILMQDTVVGENVTLEYLITDKNVIINDGKNIQGSDSFPVYIPKHHKV
ncbi:MAG: glucose-1-phosphate adenylyltransferase subunit GlgD [Eubacteriales bacterium]|nr:glucose-1-phosphate adenylyltransferase subunit GlgD [Eubacteriales bacterium]